MGVAIQEGQLEGVKNPQLSPVLAKETTKKDVEDNLAVLSLFQPVLDTSDEVVETMKYQVKLQILGEEMVELFDELSESDDLDDIQERLKYFLKRSFNLSDVEAKESTNIFMLFVEVFGMGNMEVSAQQKIAGAMGLESSEARLAAVRKGFADLAEQVKSGQGTHKQMGTLGGMLATVGVAVAAAAVVGVASAATGGAALALAGIAAKAGIAAAIASGIVITAVVQNETGLFSIEKGVDVEQQTIWNNLQAALSTEGQLRTNDISRVMQMEVGTATNNEKNTHDIVQNMFRTQENTMTMG